MIGGVKLEVVEKLLDRCGDVGGVHVNIGCKWMFDDRLRSYMLLEGVQFKNAQRYRQEPFLSMAKVLQWSRWSPGILGPPRFLENTQEDAKRYSSSVNEDADVIGDDL
ncbi:hypothetical protein Tco_1282682 [Tanacetum coccineum]